MRLIHAPYRPGKRARSVGPDRFHLVYWGFCDDTRRRISWSGDRGDWLVLRWHRFVLYIKVTR